MAASRIATLGALIADKTRAEILAALMDGRAHTGSELARHVGVAASTASEHLSKLLSSGMVAVQPQGRHRYWQLAGPEVAELLEILGASTAITAPSGPKAPTELAHARTCYDHLAGELAVKIFDALVQHGHLINNGQQPKITESGFELFATCGVDVDMITTTRRPQTRSCLDWTQRRHHLAGAAGAGVLQAFFDNKWIRRGHRPRSIEITRSGRTAIVEHFGIG